jgi:hypothetical protein
MHPAAAPLLQAEVLTDWLAVLDRPGVRGALVWRWFTDPAAGGLAATDYTAASLSPPRSTAGI